MNANAKRFDLKDTFFWKALYHSQRFLVIACSVGTTICLMVSVIMRYIFHANFYGFEEILLLFAFWLYMIGSTYGSYEDSHIKADLLQVYIKNQKVKDIILLIAQAVMVAVNVILFSWSVELMYWGITKFPQTTALHIPLVIAYTAIFLGLLLMAFYHIYYFIGDLRAFFKHQPLRMTMPRDVLLAKGIIKEEEPGTATEAAEITATTADETAEPVETPASTTNQEEGGER